MKKKFKVTTTRHRTTKSGRADSLYIRKMLSEHKTPISGFGMSVSDEDMRVARIREALRELQLQVAVGVIPANKDQMDKWVRQNRKVISEFTSFIEKVGRKGWTNLVLGTDRANELREDLTWLESQCKNQMVYPSQLEGIWELYQTIKAVGPVSPEVEYTIDYSKKMAAIEGLRTENKEFSHKLEDLSGSDDLVKAERIVIPYFGRMENVVLGQVHTKTINKTLKVEGAADRKVKQYGRMVLEFEIGPNGLVRKCSDSEHVGKTLAQMKELVKKGQNLSISQTRQREVHEFVNRTIYKVERKDEYGEPMVQFVPKTDKATGKPVEVRERVLAIMYSRGTEPGMPYSILGKDAELAYKAGNLAKAALLYKLYNDHRWAAALSKPELRMTVNGRVHVWALTHKDLNITTFSVVTSAQRDGVKPIEQKNQAVSDDWYNNLDIPNGGV